MKRKLIIIEISVILLVAIVSYNVGYFQSYTEKNKEFSILKKIIETKDIESYESIINDFDTRETIYEFPKDSLSSDRKFVFSFLMASLNGYPKAYGDACLYLNKEKFPGYKKQIATIGAEYKDPYCLKKLAFFQKQDGDSSCFKTYEQYLYYIKKSIIENVEEMTPLKATVIHVQNNLGIGFNYSYKYEFLGKSYKSEGWSITDIINKGDTINIYVNPD